MTTENRPNQPLDDAAPGFTWVYDSEEGWREVPIEVIPAPKPELIDDEEPGKWPVDITPPKPYQN